MYGYEIKHFTYLYKIEFSYLPIRNLAPLSLVFNPIEIGVYASIQRLVFLHEDDTSNLFLAVRL